MIRFALFLGKVLLRQQGGWEPCKARKQWLCSSADRVTGNRRKHPGWGNYLEGIRNEEKEEIIAPISSLKELAVNVVKSD